MSNTTNKFVMLNLFQHLTCHAGLARIRYQTCFGITLAICVFVYLFIGLFLSRAYAQTSGITVIPSIVQLDLATDKPKATIAYSNHTSQPVTLAFSTSNITGFEDSYSVTLLQPKNAQNYQYGLSSWIEFSNKSLVLDPGSTDSITIFIDKDKLSPGGHYGSVLAQIQQQNPSRSVTIKSVLATLVFVRTHTGKEYEKGSITTLAPEQNFWDFPQNFALRFTNSGDTYLIPYGRLNMYDIWGNAVGKGILNEGSLMILPQTLRRYEIPSQLFGSIVWPGIYHATLIMQFGKTNQTLTASTAFFSFGTLPILQIFLIILTIFFIIYIRSRHSATKEE